MENSAYRTDEDTPLPEMLGVLENKHRARYEDRPHVEHNIPILGVEGVKLHDAAPSMISSA